MNKTQNKPSTHSHFLIHVHPARLSGKGIKRRSSDSSLHSVCGSDCRQKQIFVSTSMLNRFRKFSYPLVTSSRLEGTTSAKSTEPQYSIFSWPPASICVTNTILDSKCAVLLILISNTSFAMKARDEKEGGVDGRERSVGRRRNLWQCSPPTSLRWEERGEGCEWQGEGTAATEAGTERGGSDEEGGGEKRQEERERERRRASLYRREEEGQST